MAGTIKFEKINGGNPYRTAFYTEDATNVAVDANVSNVGNTTTYSSMHTADTAPDDTAVITVRSYEIYVDTTTDDTEDTVTRLARILPENTTDTTDYDIAVVESGTIVGSTLGTNTLTIENITGGTVDIRVVFVCDVE